MGEFRGTDFGRRGQKFWGAESLILMDVTQTERIKGLGLELRVKG